LFVIFVMFMIKKTPGGFNPAPTGAIACAQAPDYRLVPSETALAPPETDLTASDLALTTSEPALVPPEST
jgi:hypothetical protein